MRSELVIVRMNDTEKALLQAASAKSGLSQSAIVRDATLTAVRTVLTTSTNGPSQK